MIHQDDSTSNGRASAADQRASAAEEREVAAEEREVAADERTKADTKRGSVADERFSAAEERGSATDERGNAADEREVAANQREVAADERGSVADERESAAEKRDIAATERDSVAQLREQNYALALLASAPDAMVVVDARGMIQFANSETEKLFRFLADELVGQHIETLLPPLCHDDAPNERTAFFAAPRVGETGEDLDLWGRRKDGTEFAVEIRFSALDTEDGVLAAAAIRDVTERREAQQFREAVLDNMADGLLVADGNDCMTYANSAAARMLGFADGELLDKPMHDTVHYQRADGTAFPAAESELVHLHADGVPVRRVEDAFTRKDGSILPVAYSAAPLGSGSSSYGAVVVFRDTTEERAQATLAQKELATLTWVGRVRDALDENRLVLYSQPILPLGDGEPSEELLVRMLGRDGEVIPPVRFLPAAEKYGLIGQVDRWVISQAILLAATEERIFHANLSADSIGNLDLLPVIEMALRDTGADPSRLVFEITETALMGDIETGEAFARRVTELGCGVALDDFGTGFGSFTYLQRLPMNYLKIDIDFVRNLPSNVANQHLVKGIIHLAKAFGHRTIAEGVEDAQTMVLLREYGVDFVQGYYVGRPGPVTHAACGAGARG